MHFFVFTAFVASLFVSVPSFAQRDAIDASTTINTNAAADDVETGSGETLDAMPDGHFEGDDFEDDYHDADETPFGARAEVTRPVDQSYAYDASSASTEVELRQGESVANALRRVPGARVVESGGLGSFTALRLRGAELGHTEVFLGDLPISTPDGGAFDLGSLGAGAFSDMRAFRGGAPAWLASGSIGGVLQFVTLGDTLDGTNHELHPSRRLWAGLSAGSFSTWRLDLGARVIGQRTRLLTALSLEGSQNNYPYFDDGGTAFDPSDDRERHRQNAQTLRGSVLAQFTHRQGRNRWSGLVLATSRQGGEPGAGLTLARRARRNDLRIFSALKYKHTLPLGRFQIAATGSFYRRTFDDRFGEIGLGQEASDDRFRGGTLRVGLQLLPLDQLELTIITEARIDNYLPRDELSLPHAEATRLSGVSLLEARLHGDFGNAMHAELRGHARLMVSSLRVEAVDAGGYEPDVGFRFSPTFRVGGLFAFSPAIAIVASFSQGERVPTFIEFFGDRTTLVPNPRLRPELGRSFDGGILVRRESETIRLALEARAFHLSVSDLIRYIPTSQFTAVAQNVVDASITGGEFGGVFEFRDRFTLQGTLTGLKSDDRSRQLNWRPKFETQWSARVGTGSLSSLRNISLETTVRHRSAFFQDPANFIEVAAVTWLDLRAVLEWHMGLSIVVELSDLLDNRGADYLGYPLPGRRVLFSFRLEQ